MVEVFYGIFKCSRSFCVPVLTAKHSLLLYISLALLSWTSSNFFYLLATSIFITYSFLLSLEFKYVFINLMTFAPFSHAQIKLVIFHQEDRWQMPGPWPLSLSFASWHLALKATFLFSTFRFPNHASWPFIQCGLLEESSWLQLLVTLTS